MSDFEIQTRETSVSERQAARRKNNTTRLVITGASAAGLLFVGLLVIMAMRSGEQQPPQAVQEPPEGGQPVVPAPQPAAVEEPDEPEPASATLVDDDGRTMWMSPTDGGPIDLAGLPPGCELFVALRPAELLASGDGAKWLAALGPRGELAKQYVEQTCGLELRDINTLLVGVRPAPQSAIETALVVTPTAGVTPRARGYHVTGEKDYYVFATPRVLDEVKELEGWAPPLRREVESLVAATDADRHVTLMASPMFLFDDGRAMWQGSLSGLRDLLFQMLPDTTRCAALSLHAGDDFFAEARLSATIDQRPQAFGEKFADKVATWPASVERTIASVPASQHSAAVVARLPAMLRVLNRYQRVGVDGEQALLRVYLPPSAGHNLLMAGELLLAERAAGGGSVAAATPPEAKPKSIDEALNQMTSLSFARDTLEMAVKLLGEDVGVDIVLLGGDLQLDGITKNQSFALDEKNKPAGEILVSILRLANPDKTATGPADPKQKLVYVIGKHPQTGQPAVLVTTRAQAAKRGDELPMVFAE
ncbi:hypothetical protein [Aeoliella sp.]|uniref:hypothetical protein n=1 Tax=Aeoliella sp. TaxID=2795800 RepID=UPI003CCB789B